MKKSALAFLAVMAVLTAGCPRNYYQLTLTPRGNVMERELIFFRADTESQSADGRRFLAFDSNELAAIAALYPKDQLKSEDNRHAARGEFMGRLPGDIGGSGWYKRLTTSMGAAGFYAERYRGNDDLAGAIEKKYQAADQLADLAVGWSQAHFGRESNYKKLHHFLGQDFRRDLKNFSLYFERADSAYKEDGWSNSKGYLSRLGQYLIERGYATLNDSPALIRVGDVDDDSVLCTLLQRLIARKLDVTDGQPLPRTLMFLADPSALGNSLKEYLTGTEAYRAELRAWETKKRADPEARKPEPEEALDELVIVLLGMESSSEEDRITVRLSLPSEPLRTNGKWDETHKQAMWDSNLPDGKQPGRLPAFGYADWVEPREDFQKDHLGGVVLTGENLLQYCIWQTGLGEEYLSEWERFVAGLHPGKDALDTLEKFRFTREPGQTDTDALKHPADIGRRLIKSALQAKQ
ncbi:MAG: hypothetical protein JXA73_07755 [Acidobacteria bacterium]|nr:hypothetical protein [Acidobacteriota bacterium]